MKILVVGGGSAGLIAAIILKKFLNSQVDLVYSKNIGIIGVGEGSTEHFNDFMNFVGIDQYSILKECDATFKSGIMFEGWGEKKRYLHSVGEPFSNKFAQYPFVSAKQISQNDQFINSKLLWENKINLWYLNKNETPPFNQYHFNTHKLNDFLFNFSKKNNIEIFEDEIKNINFKESGEIKELVGEKTKYQYDFYIDATGFKKILIGQMGAEWISFNKYLKMKSAIVFPTGDEEEYNLWTLSKAMNYGWRFKIPTWGRHGNGYIFDSDYITADQAKDELDKEFGFDVEISKEFKFDPGYLKNVWIKNCVAVGLSGSFVEPLEATSIGTTIQQCYILMQKINNYSEKEIEEYNKTFSSIMENIRDYISLHYITSKDDTIFWKDMQNIKIPDSLSYKLEIWKNKMPIRNDFSNQSYYSLFWEDNFIQVMDGLNIFNRKSIKKEYEMINDGAKIIAKETIENFINYEKSLQTIGHKKYIEIMRSL